VNGRSRVSVSCSYTDSVWLCNDNNHHISVSCSYLGDMTGRILSKCSNTTLSNCRRCPFGAWSHLVNRQQFKSGKYNIVRRNRSCWRMLDLLTYLLYKGYIKKVFPPPL
jgi:hypothetical protein